MTTATKTTGQEEKITALYGRLSDDDGVDMESNSISNQRTILTDYCRQKGYTNPQFFYDDGVSGTTFQRPGFQEMEAMVEAGKVSTIIVKDLSRFGRNYLEVGRYLEVVYPTLGVKFIAIQENVDTLEGTGTEMMPFHNIFKNIGSLGMASTKYPFFRIALLLYIAFQRNYSVVHPAPGKIPEQDAQSRLLHT